VHSDVGGGYPETGLSDIALEWMADKARERSLCLDFTWIDNPPISADPMGKMHDSQTWVYKIATLAFVKIPSAFRVPLPKIDPEDVKHINWRGDFVRHFPDDMTVHPAVQARNSALQTPPPPGP
jgi:hypothetical protein